MVCGITGGAGFIGTWIAKTLKEQGCEVVVFDHSIRAEPHPYADRIFFGNVVDTVDVVEFAAHVDGIIHLAAVLGTQETIGNPTPSVKTNILGTLNVLEAATQYELPVVYAGVGNHFFRNQGATGSYTISKAAAEDYCRMFAEYRELNVDIVRPVNAYGPGQSIAKPFGPSKVRKIMPAMICRALVGMPIEVYGSGEQTSDCVYVQDVANVFAKMILKRGFERCRTVEVGPVESVTVLQIASLISEYVSEETGKSKVDIEHLPMRPGELPNAVVRADTSTLMQIEMEAKNFVPLIQGIARTVDYYRENWLPYAGKKFVK